MDPYEWNYNISRALYEVYMWTKAMFTGGTLQYFARW